MRECDCFSFEGASFLNDHDRRLFLACKNGDVDEIEGSVNDGANVNAMIEVKHFESELNDVSPLHVAAQFGKADAIIKLLGLGAEVNKKCGYLYFSSRSSGDNMYNGKEAPLHFASAGGHEKAVIFLLEHGADKNANNSENQTPFHLAAEANRVGVMKLLIEKKINVKSRDKRGNTLLHSVAGNAEIVKLLISKGANVRAKDNYLATPLHLASEKGVLDSVKVMIEKGADVNAKGNFNPICYAAKNGHLDVVKILIENGADINTKGLFGFSLLHLAAEGDYVQMAEFLMDKGLTASLIAKYKYEYNEVELVSPLHVAAYKGNVQVARKLLESGGEVNVMDGDGQTALHIAAELGSYSMVELLIDFGADVNAISSKNHYPICGGYTPLHFAAKVGNEKIIQLLLDKNADVNAKDKSGKTPLHYASEEGYVRVIKLLVANNASVTDIFDNGRTALHLASTGGHIEAMTFLIDSGADVNANCRGSFERDIEFNTPLHSAALGAKFEAVKLLFTKGANMSVDQINKSGYLESAVRSDDIELMKLWIKQGADVNCKSNSYGEFGPMKVALNCWKVDAIKFLIKSGANFNFEILYSDDLFNTKYLVTPLFLAIKNGDIPLAKLLVEKGAELTAKSEAPYAKTVILEAESNYLMMESFFEMGIKPNVVISNCGERLKNRICQAVGGVGYNFFELACVYINAGADLSYLEKLNMEQKNAFSKLVEDRIKPMAESAKDGIKTDRSRAILAANTLLHNGFDYVNNEGLTHTKLRSKIMNEATVFFTNWHGKALVSSAVKLFQSIGIHACATIFVASDEYIPLNKIVLNRASAEAMLGERGWQKLVERANQEAAISNEIQM